MKRITLAYCSDNQPLAAGLDHKLTRIGIAFRHLTEQPGDSRGAFARNIGQSEEPVLLIVTDNLLKNASCMDGLLQGVRDLAARQLLYVVVADGFIRQPNGAVETVHTQIDRMVHALHYMNHWQHFWLAISDRMQNETDPAQKTALENTLATGKDIANTAGDLISALREVRYLDWNSLEANQFERFFQLFGIGDWHVQYQQLAAYEVPPAPEKEVSEPVATVPVFAGPLTPQVVESPEITPAPEPVEPEPEPEAPDFSEMNSLLEELADEEPFEVPVHIPEPEKIPEPETVDEEAEENAGYTDTEIQQTIRDAWFWLDKGHVQQGMDLLNLSLEQHPGHAALEAARAEAVARFGKYLEPQPQEEPAVLPSPPASNQENELHSYDLMGDMAADKGDYMFAKYCWDRVVDLAPDFPGIYRKLGMMTAEHLREYKDTAAQNLHKALEQQPDDAEVHLVLADLAHQSGQAEAAATHYRKAIELNPSLQLAGLDQLYLPKPPAPLPVAEPEPPTAPEPVAEPVVPAKPGMTVLITGATSGIGRATARIFAQNGHRLILTGRRADRLSELKAELENEHHIDVLILPFDVRNQPLVQQAIEHLPESWQEIDVLVNNAGLAKGLSPIHEGDLDHWETMIDTNLKGLLYVTRAVAPGMVRRRKGHIVNLGSSASKEAYPNGNVYCATKFAVEALTRAMRMDLYTHNIRVSQVSPGHVEETEFAITRFDGDAERAKIYNDFEPLKANDVADVIYFMVTRPAHVNIQDVYMFGTQQASAMLVDRSGRKNGGF